MGEVSEHDYATYIIEQAMESEENQVVIEMGEFVDAEDFFLKSDDTHSTIPHATIAIDQQASGCDVLPNYRSEATRGTSGYWSEADVNRLLRIYIKHIKTYANLRGRPINFVWDKIARDFDSKNRFTRHQIKTKIQRLKNNGKLIIDSGQEQNSKWPFLKPVMEILKVEGGNVKYSGRAKSGVPMWSQKEISDLLVNYKKQLTRMPKNEPLPSRRQLFARVAKEVGRPRFDVQLKFQSLKASWKRCIDGLMQSSWPHFDIMEEIIELERIRTEAEDAQKFNEKQDQDANAPVRWEKEETKALLECYKANLESMKGSKQVLTKRQLYRLVANSLSLSVQAVQVKITSLRTHWKKHGRFSNNKWSFFNLMRDIMKLESSIWGQNEEESDQVEEDPEAQKLLRLAKDYPEPVWLKHYRAENQRRYEESAQLKSRLVDVLETLVITKFWRQSNPL